MPVPMIEDKRAEPTMCRLRTSYAWQCENFIQNFFQNGIADG